MQSGFRPGRNIAMKVPAHEYEQTAAFYRDVLEFRELGGADSVTRMLPVTARPVADRPIDPPRRWRSAEHGGPGVARSGCFRVENAQQNQ